MGDKVTFEELAPFLSERGRLEVEVASLKALVARQKAYIAEIAEQLREEP